jgi:hypothetical protein
MASVLAVGGSLGVVLSFFWYLVPLAEPEVAWRWVFPAGQLAVRPLSTV